MKKLFLSMILIFPFSSYTMTREHLRCLHTTAKKVGRLCMVLDEHIESEPCGCAALGICLCGIAMKSANHHALQNIRSLLTISANLSSEINNAQLGWSIGTAAAHLGALVAIPPLVQLADDCWLQLRRKDHEE